MNSIPENSAERAKDSLKCNVCKQHFPATPKYFVVDKSLSRGIKPLCRTCQRKDSRERTQKKRTEAEIKERRRAYWQKRKQELQAKKAELKPQNLEVIEAKKKYDLNKLPDIGHGYQDKIEQAKRLQASGIVEITPESLRLHLQVTPARAKEIFAQLRGSHV